MATTCPRRRSPDETTEATTDGKAQAQAEGRPQAAAEADPQLHPLARARGRLADRHRRGRRPRRRGAAVPPRKDLRAAWWRINDQGSTGSCVGWASADGVLRWHFVKTNRIGQSELISPRFQWMAAKETDEFNSRPTTFVEAEGTSLKAALDVSRKFGAVKDTVLPFASALASVATRAPSTRSRRSSRSACTSTSAARSGTGASGSRPRGRS